MTPHGPQRAFLKDPHRFVLACAGHQSGKTRSAAPKFAKRVRRTYNRLLRTRRTAAIVANFWVVVPSYKLAVMPYRYLREIWPQGWSNKHGEVFLLCEPYPGCRVSIRSAEIPESLVSEDVDGVWVNEAARCKAEAWRGSVLMRLTATGGWCILDTTPMGQNWVYTDVYIPSCPPGTNDHDAARYDPEYKTHQWGTIALAEVKPEVAERIESQRRTMQPAYFAREFLADFSAFHGQIYETFLPKEHVRAVQPSDYPEVVIGVDWGFAEDHPGAAVVVALDRKGKRAGVIRSVIESQRTDDWWQERICELARDHGAVRAWCDPSRPALMEALRRALRAQGLGCQVREAENAVYDGLMFLAGMFGRGSLLIAPGNDRLVQQLRNYHWDSPAGGTETRERPAKVDDDGCDALRYAIASELMRKALTFR